ncbi:MAG: coproporphyrinogen dehydrogenase HemZ [Clostridia bacterium]|nr:coproporphyrinogen dehydrogenase HemZ [Clostridia bacterium]
MKLWLIGNGFRYELENLCRLFFPFERIDVADVLPGEEDGFCAWAARTAGGDGVALTAGLRCSGFDERASGTLPSADDKTCERRLAVLLFGLLCQATGARPPWGILTGVRPGKLMRRLSEDLGVEGAKAYFRDELLCREEKIDLCLASQAGEEAIIASSRPEQFSLYFSVPFCPTRCSYCSFVSHSIERSGKLIEPYVVRLCEELRATGEVAKRLGLKLATAYMGGGTPTTLSADQLDRVFAAVAESFDLGEASEFTVEAGRPDTVTPERLAAIQRGGATRISINPQSLNDRVLEAIGRRHTARQTLDAFALARQAGFTNINMDLIAGLPGDDPASFSRTLDGVLALDPESVTVHTLSLKRASRMTVGGDRPAAEAGESANRMLTEARQRLGQAGLAPYYLYRQSKTVGNLENTGYAKPGFEGRYNVFIMDETHSILACGAGAVTKLRAADGFIERVFNFKYPYEYLSRFDEILARKAAIEAFYEKHPLL